MTFEMLQNWNSDVSTPEDLFLAMFASFLMFLFIIGLYPAILILGHLELQDKEIEQ